MINDGSYTVGTVVSFSRMRGFGFVKSDDGGGDDVYVHRTQLLSARFLRAGDRVSFAVIDSGGRRSAVRVRQIW